MHSKWTVFKTLLLFGSVTLLAPSCPARAANTCSLPPRMYDHRKTVEPLSDAQREIDHKYLDFMKAVAQLYAQHDAAAVNMCCDAVNEDIIGFQFCALVRYLLSNRKESDPFLAAMPGTDDQRKAFWFMEQISAGGTEVTPRGISGAKQKSAAVPGSRPSESLSQIGRAHV